MTTKALSERLASLCAEPKLETPAGRVFVPRQPVDLLEELSGLLDDDREEELLWNGFAAVAEKWWGAGIWRPAIEFLWQGRAQAAWSKGVHVLILEGRRFLALPIDDWGNAERVIARVEPELTGELLGAFLADAAPSNGRDYGFELLDSPPSRTLDHVGIPRELLARAYAGWLDHNEAPMSWLELCGWLIEQIDEPDPLTRGLRLIRGVPDPDEAVLEKRDRLRRESATVTDEQKRFILDAYLDRTVSRRAPR